MNNALVDMRTIGRLMSRRFFGSRADYRIGDSVFVASLNHHQRRVERSMDCKVVELHEGSQIPDGYELSGYGKVLANWRPITRIMAVLPRSVPEDDYTTPAMGVFEVDGKWYDFTGGELLIC